MGEWPVRLFFQFFYCLSFFLLICRCSLHVIHLAENLSQSASALEVCCVFCHSEVSLIDLCRFTALMWPKHLEQCLACMRSLGNLYCINELSSIYELEK